MIGTLALGIGPIVVVLSVIIILMLVFLYFKQQRVYKKIKHIDDMIHQILSLQSQNLDDENNNLV
jgi:predicted membrane protein